MDLAAATGVTARISYTVDTGEKLVNETFGPNNIRRRTSGAQELRDVDLLNGRPLLDALTLERNGFTLVRHETAVKDFFDAEELKSVYYPEVERLIREASGAARARRSRRNASARAASRTDRARRW